MCTWPKRAKALGLQTERTSSSPAAASSSLWRERLLPALLVAMGGSERAKKYLLGTTTS